jgi:hypothetical protein
MGDIEMESNEYFSLLENNLPQLFLTLRVYSYMKVNPNSIVIIFTVILTLSYPLEAKDRGDTTLKAILLDADEYKNDHVTYEAVYGGFTTNAPLFLDKNGFKEGKDVVINAGSPQFLIIAERDSVEKTLLNLKRGSIIKVSGKVKEMKNDPKRGIGTGFYLELKSLEVVKAAERDMDRKDQLKKGPKKPGAKL